MQKSVKEDRNLYIGGSDIPAIMGISLFKTRYELLLEKAGLKEDNFEGNEYTEYGNIMEEKIRNYMNEIDHTEYKEDKLIKDDIRCHVDGYNGQLIIEIKTTSQVHEELKDYKSYLVQLLFYMYNYNKDAGQLCVYHRPDDFNEEFDNRRLTIFDVQLEEHKELVEQIKKSVEQFRIDLQKLKENPLLTEEDLMPNDIVSVSNKILLLEEKLKEYKKLENEQKELKNQLKDLMKEKGIKNWETPNGTKITLVDDAEDKEVLEFNEKKFKEENKEIYDKYLETKIKKGRSGYVLITIPKDDDND